MTRYKLVLAVAVVLVAATALFLLREPPRSLHTTLGDPQVATPEPTLRDPDESVSPVHPTHVPVGSDIQAVVQSQPPGTTFMLEAGVHRLQEIRPRDGDRFVGEPGAVLSGARLLRPGDFRQEGDVWVIRDQTQEGFVHGTMDPGHEREAHPEDVYADGRRLRHVGSRASVDEPGEWFLDYDRDEIVMADDPHAFEMVEAAVAEFAFSGEGIRGVTVENLTVRHYANWAQRGAINGRDSIEWTIRNVEASSNHALGLGIGPGMVVELSRFAHNGQLGVGGTARAGSDSPARPPNLRPVQVRTNEITSNGELGYEWSWEAGGTKFVDTRSLVIANNLVTGNDGPGLWYDIDNVDTIVCSNRVEDNVIGIFAEISYGTTVAWNLVWNNVRNGDEDASVGIYISATSDAEVFDNIVAGHHAGILAKENDRGEGALGRYSIDGLSVHDNVIADFVRSGVVVGTGREEPFSTAQFQNNRWLVDDPDAARWEWRGDLWSWDRWRSAGMDADGELTSVDDVTLTLPRDTPQFTPAAYGPQDQPGSGSASPAASRCEERLADEMDTSR